MLRSARPSLLLRCARLFLIFVRGACPLLPCCCYAARAYSSCCCYCPGCASGDTVRPAFLAGAGGGRDKAEMEAKEARERHKNRMDKGRPPPPLPPSSHRRSRRQF
ncbi:hypothetical protein OsJ_28525 [Oryza sativa Japonica Group]|uniref:Secreted protein n=1 Tax=Oryza sativa subsp. japonica TaxID=39947 RepID=B9G2B9_ORYSJ|nr:hypothetical protein OsJ_28525 [Oryza sativa Japonica Group]